MATTINSNTTDGLVITPDTSGEIKLQSAGADIATVSSTGIALASGKGFSGDGSSLTGIASGAFTTHLIQSGTTFTPKSTSTKMYVGVYGSLGGTSASYGGGIGGSGFSEKYYNGSLASSYSYSIGAAGTSSGTAGGTTTFDVISVTGGGGVTGNTGSSGGVGSGGDFNATGGTGGNGNGSSAGGNGGDATRAGNGGNGANQTGSAGGGGGGTGGNNASGTTGGAAATSADASALDLSTILDIYFLEYFIGGGAGSTNNRGGFGAPARVSTSWLSFNDASSIRPVTTNYTARNGQDSGFIMIVEW